MFLAILIAWNLPILRDVISGLKVSTECASEKPVAWAEAGRSSNGNLQVYGKGAGLQLEVVSNKGKTWEELARDVDLEGTIATVLPALTCLTSLNTPALRRRHTRTLPPPYRPNLRWSSCINLYRPKRRRRHPHYGAHAELPQSPQ